MKRKNAIFAAALNVCVLCAVASAQTNGYMNCERAVVYKEAPLSTSERTIAGSLAEKTTVSIWRERFGEYLVSGGGTQGYVKKDCVTIGTPPPRPAAPPTVSPPIPVNPAPTQVMPTDASAVDCKKVHGSEGCKSFNELMSAKDDGVFLWLSGRAWVCFKTSSSGYGKDEKGKAYSYGPFDETEDKFYLISQTERRKGGMLLFHIYDKGILSEGELGWFIADEWRFVDVRPNAKKSSPEFSGVSTEDEIWFERRFLNRNNTITTEHFTLRISTGRFTNEYEMKSPNPHSSTESGYCIKNSEAAPQPRTATPARATEGDIKECLKSGACVEQQ